MVAVSKAAALIKIKMALDLQPVPFFSVILAKLMASNHSAQSKTNQKGNC
jgi:hypothetical protein